eukprot:Rmarinus@m.9089
MALHPESSRFRFWLLFFASFLIFGNYFVMDQPGSLQGRWVPDEDNDEDCDDEDWKDEGVCLSYTEYSLLYSVYYFPNIVLAMFGGILCDRLGFRTASLLFSSIILVGQSIVAIGANAQSFWVMLVGRFVYAWGGEGCAVSQNVIVSKYFHGKELALSLGIALAVGRCGSGLNFLITDPVAEETDYAFALWIGTITCALSVVCCLCVNYMDRTGDQYYASRGHLQAEKKPLLDDSNAVDDADEKSASESVAPAAGMFDAIKEFPEQFWLCVACVMAFYGGIFPFNGNAVDLLEKLWETGGENYIVSIPLFLAVILAPLFGRMIDRVGNRPFYVCVSCLLVGLAHLLLGVLEPDMVPSWMEVALPVALVVLYGTGYSLFVSSLYPCIPIILRDEKVLGSAFGVIFSLQNLGLIIITQAVGVVRDRVDDQTTELLFAGCEIVAFAIGLRLYYLDKQQGGLLSQVSGADSAEEDTGVKMPSVLEQPVRGNANEYATIVDEDE